ncbi:hypothetical protein AXF42_Ash001691 [Apostasia shenzhenica]|uniref:Cell division control protein 24 OB domain-containing protein n=1 Tax=Apostasia shenzhenica TaxID=1088818 RepID=A0A2I0AAZ0_9ASPA|nr:hypothetical protein AXF42_Ash001691 [Apostasia shenzhenica]
MASPSEMSQPTLHPHGDSVATAKEEDGFLGFVAYAKLTLFSDEDESVDSGYQDDSARPSWSWIVSRILKTCVSYPSGVTTAILLSDLFQAWCEQRKYLTSKKKLEWMIPLKRRRRRTRLPNTVTIDSIYEKNFLSSNSCLEAVVFDSFLLPGTKIYMLSLGDLWSSSTIDLYLHRRYYKLVELDNGILRKGREILLTGCCFRPTKEGSGHHRLLPTEYLVILLDEDEDEDAMLLGAQFCTDSFSTISPDAVKDGSVFSFYARIEAIGSLEVQGGSLQKRQITLIDNDGIKMKFLLWGEQVLLANLFSVGSMLALDTPFIANAPDSGGMGEDICLEYGSATQLYIVPFVEHEEQIHLTSTQMRCHGSNSSCILGQSQNLKASQVTLPLNSQGSIDFSNYPFRAYVNDLTDKMTSVSLYGVVTNMTRDRDAAYAVFSITIEDTTGAVVVKLHFVGSWSLGRLGHGHTVYVTGLNCALNRKKRLEVSWFERDSGSAFVNLSCLPALLNSSCLYRLSYLSDMSRQMNATNICCVSLNLVELHHVRAVLSHSICCHPVIEIDDAVQCSLCLIRCDSELIRCFHLEVTVTDESSSVFAWATGQTACELLQISPDEFFELPEDEQAMYLYTLEKERFMVAIVNSSRTQDRNPKSCIKRNFPGWEITRCQKCRQRSITVSLFRSSASASSFGLCVGWSIRLCRQHLSGPSSSLRARHRLGPQTPHRGDAARR